MAPKQPSRLDTRKVDTNLLPHPVWCSLQALAISGFVSEAAAPPIKTQIQTASYANSYGRSRSRGHTGGNSENHALYSVTQDKLLSSFELRHVQHINEYMSCFGSSHAWLAYVNYSGSTMELNLINPFTAAKIPTQIPQSSRDWGEWDYKQKVVLSADPSLLPRDYEIVAINGNCCHHLKSRDDTWTLIDTQSPPNGTGICLKGCNLPEASFLLSLTEVGFIVLMLIQWNYQFPLYDTAVYYLAESSRGELLLVPCNCGGAFKNIPIVFELFYRPGDIGPVCLL